MCTCLHIAAGNGHDKVVNELLKTKNVRVDAFDKVHTLGGGDDDDD